MKMLDLFAGTGVGVAAKNLGIDEYGVELAPPAVKSRNTAGFKTLYNDVLDIEKAKSLYFDILWASPPCQTFSVAGGGDGRKALDDVLKGIESEAWINIPDVVQLGVQVGDERTALVLTPLTYIHTFRPRFVVLEQVPTVLPVWEKYREPLTKMSYSSWVGVLNTEQYGVPQTRRRAFLIARLDDVEAKPPVPTHSKFHSQDPAKLDAGVRKWVSIAEALGWKNNQMPKSLLKTYAGDVKTGGRDVLFTNQSTVKLNQSKYWVFSASSIRANTALRLFSQPAPTLAFGHNFPRLIPVTRTGVAKQIRGNSLNYVPLSISDTTILQGYPEGFVFEGNRSQQFLQIGNSVPPPLVEAILQTFL